MAVFAHVDSSAGIRHISPKALKTGGNG